MAHHRSIPDRTVECEFTDHISCCGQGEHLAEVHRNERVDTAAFVATLQEDQPIAFDHSPFKVEVIDRSCLDVLGVGATYFMMGLAADTYWLAASDFDAEYHELHARHAFGDSSSAAFASLARARAAYFSHFRLPGIEEPVMLNLISMHRSISAE